MNLRGDERGQAIQIGAILLFAMLIILASMYQAYVIPQQTAEIEFDDYREASADVISARNGLLATASENAQHGQTVTTGSTYPSRVFFVNPPSPSGRVVTTENESVSLTNVEGVGENPNVDQYFSSQPTPRNLTFQTRHLRFVPDYNRFDAAPLVVTQGVVYRSYENPVPLTTQTLVQGNRITLVTLGGDLETGGLTAALTFEPLSTHTRTVTVTGNGSQPLTLTIPTSLDASVWEERLLVGQMDPLGAPFWPDRFVTNVSNVPGRDAVKLTFEANERYELRLARVLVHSESDDAAERRPDPRYIVASGDTKTQTGNDGRVKLVLEARDRFNNPVSNANVTFSSSAGTFETRAGENVTDLALGNPGITVKTNENGHGIVYFNATNHLGNIPVTGYLGNDTTGTGEKRVTYSVFNTVTNVGGGGGGGEQGGRSLLVLQNTQFNPNAGTLQLSFRNRGSFPTNITGYRLDYAVIYTSQGNRVVVDGPEYIDYVSIDQQTGPDQQLPTQPADNAAQEGRAPYFLQSPFTVSGSETFTATVYFSPALTYTSNNAAGSVSLAFYLEGGLTVTVTVFDDQSP